MLEKDDKFCWNEQCQISFEILKTNISSAHVLRGPNWSGLFLFISSQMPQIKLWGLF
jgi:hypothetical protein